MSKLAETTDGWRVDMKNRVDREGLEGIEEKKDVADPGFFLRGYLDPQI